MNFTTYQDATQYLYEQLPMFHRIGAAAYRNNLNNIISLLEKLGNPEKNLTCIHIAGTNGKGSTSNMLAAILQKAGYKTGLYTSPHLVDFRERIRINGIMIDEEFVINFTNKIKNSITELNPSFFEITVAMCFSYFKENSIDIAIIETGLGGRLDATNVIHPLLSIITNISLDHTNLLGDTLEKIAIEKAGIIKKNVPVIIGTHSSIDAVFIEKAKQESSEIFFAQDYFEINSIQNRMVSVEDKNNGNNVIQYELDLQGVYQTKNLGPVLKAIAILQEKYFNISEQNIYDGLKNTTQITGLQGRWQTIKTIPLTIADIAHNVDGISHVMLQCKQIMQHKNKCHIVFGMVADKDIDAVLQLLIKEATYYFCKPNLPRGLDANTLAKQAQKFNLTGNIYSSVQSAYQSALENSKDDDMILITGSNFVVAEIL